MGFANKMIPCISVGILRAELYSEWSGFREKKKGLISLKKYHFFDQILKNCRAKHCRVKTIAIVVN